MKRKKHKQNETTEIFGSLTPDLEGAPSSMFHLHRYAGLKREEWTALKAKENKRKKENKKDWTI